MGEGGECEEREEREGGKVDSYGKNGKREG